MDIGLIGATGHVGSRILAELARRGHTVTAIARNPGRIALPPGVTAAGGDAADPVDLADLLKGHDAAVSAVPFASSDPDKLIEAVKRAGLHRYVVVGGAGSLEVEPGIRLIDTPEFPEAHKDEAEKGAAFLDRLRREKELEWTFLSPSANFAPGERTGTFRLGQDRLLVDAKGESRISFEDFAMALVDELENPKHIRQRFTVGY
jgi:putative NADH-flavin reductase